VDNKVLNVGAWMPYHPGGDKAMRHMIGRDATDEVTRYVERSLPIVIANLCA
jgi:delta8-fatty-acid desaturase